MRTGVQMRKMTVRPTVSPVRTSSLPSGRAAGSGSARRALTVVVAVLAVVVLGLSGCSVRSGSVAAYIGDTSITNDQLSEVVDAISHLLPEGQTVNENVVLTALVKGQLARTVAAQRGIALSDGERDQFISQQSKVDQSYAEYVNYLTDPVAAQAVFGFADYDIMVQRLGSVQAFSTTAQQVGVELNPRFGNWVYVDGDMGIRVGSSGSLSTPLPSSGT